jgi:hypothetical protein
MEVHCLNLRVLSVACLRFNDATSLMLAFQRQGNRARDGAGWVLCDEANQ